jgi:hypothetical protein
MINGTNAIGAWCSHLVQETHTHDVLRLNSDNVGIGVNGLRIRQFECDSRQETSRYILRRGALIPTSTVSPKIRSRLPNRGRPAMWGTMTVVAFNRCTDPKTFAEMKPPGYWCTSSNQLVPVTLISEEKMAERIAERDEWFTDRDATQSKS